MIHGQARQTTNAAKATNYFLQTQFFDLDTKTWLERDPRPVILDGDPDAVRDLCDSLTFKNSYTSGVLSFSKEESRLIESTPGMKQQILQELKDFAFAGVPDDCRQILAVQHTHLDRLEIHYLIPRVHLGTGKYFNPFPPSYDGKLNYGKANAFIDDNNAFVDYMCDRYGLQNPRDPDIAQLLKVAKFDPQKATKKDVHADIVDRIADGEIASREDIITHLKGLGGEITRQGEDYISVSFEGKKAIRLRGELYSVNFSADGARAEKTARTERDISADREQIRSAYRGVIEKRVAYTESKHRHIEKGGLPEDAQRFERKSGAIEELAKSCPDIGSVYDAVAGLQHDLAAEGIDIGSVDTDVSSGATSDDPTLRFFINMADKYAKAIVAARKRGQQELERISEGVQRKLYEQARTTLKSIFGVVTGRVSSASEIRNQARIIKEGEVELNQLVTADLDAKKKALDALPTTPSTLDLSDLLKKIRSDEIEKTPAPTGKQPRKQSKWDEDYKP